MQRALRREEERKDREDQDAKLVETRAYFFQQILKNSDSTVGLPVFEACHTTCRFAIQRGPDTVARKYAFLSVHRSPPSTRLGTDGGEGASRITINGNGERCSTP